jgi:lycopene cyclase domain-containing protein
MGLCLLLTLPLEFVFGARVYRRFRTLLLALLPEVVVFSIWDIVGIARDHWTYNPGFVTGFRLPFRMPIEELVFFLVVPICGVLTYEAVGVVLGRLRRLRAEPARRGGARA